MWDQNRKDVQKAGCKLSAEVRRCPKCGRGAALRRDRTCRYCLQPQTVTS